MIELDMKGKSLSPELAYKVEILVANELGQPEEPVDGFWKMHPLQVLAVAQCYTNVLMHEKSLGTPKQTSIRYGGHGIEEDSSVPKIEIQFLDKTNSLLAKVINLAVPEVNCG